MKTNNPKFAVGVAVAFCFSLLGITENLSAAIFADNFDSYTATNRLATGANWPSAIPNTSGQYWKTGYWGTNAIVDATSLGRSGNVYASSVASGQNNAFSQTVASNAYTNAGSWTLSFDFRIDPSLTAPSLSTAATMLDIFDTQGATNFASTNSLARVYATSYNGTNKVGFAAAASSPGGSIEYNWFSSLLTTNDWYTITVNGDNTAQTMSFTLTAGTNNTTISNKYYLRDRHQLDGFVIGNTGDAVTGTFYLDNISMVPEPSVSFLIGVGMLGLVLATIRRRKRA